MTIFELPITLIDSETGKPVAATAIINTVTRETVHRMENQGADTVLFEEEPDG